MLNPTLLCTSNRDEARECPPLSRGIEDWNSLEKEACRQIKMADFLRSKHHTPHIHLLTCSWITRPLQNSLRAGNRVIRYGGKKPKPHTVLNINFSLPLYDYILFSTMLYFLIFEYIVVLSTPRSREALALFQSVCFNT